MKTILITLLFTFCIWAQTQPYPSHPNITSITFSNAGNTLADGSDNWFFTTNKDNEIWLTWGDGQGAGGCGNKYGLGISTITGTYASFTMSNFLNGCNATVSNSWVFNSSSNNGGKSHSQRFHKTTTDTLYFWKGGDGSTNYAFEYNELWVSYDGAAPVYTGVRFDGNDVSSQADEFYHINIVQTGHANNDDFDNFVYMVAQQIVAGDARSDYQMMKPAKFTLLKVHEDSIESESDYWVYAGRDGSGDPTWTKNLNNSVPIFEADVNTGARHPNMAYLDSLGVFMLTAPSVGHNRGAGALYGIYFAENPWGRTGVTDTDSLWWAGYWKSPYASDGEFMDNDANLISLQPVPQGLTGWDNGDSADYIVIYNDDDRFRTAEMRINLIGPITGGGGGGSPPGTPATNFHLASVYDSTIFGDPPPDATTPPAPTTVVFLGDSIGLTDSMVYKIKGFDPAIVKIETYFNYLGNGVPNETTADIDGLVSTDTLDYDSTKHFLNFDTDTTLIGGVRVRRTAAVWSTMVFDTFTVDSFQVQTNPGSFPPAGSPLALGTHPRLFLVDAEWQTLAQYLLDNDASAFQTWIDLHDGSNFTRTISGLKNRPLKAATFNYAMLSYMVESGYFTGFSFAKTSAQYTDKSYANATELETRDLWDHGSYDEQKFKNKTEGWPSTIPWGVLYDWCYNQLTSGEKTNLADWMIKFWDTSDNISDPENKHGGYKRFAWKFMFAFSAYHDEGSAYDAVADAQLGRYVYEVEDRSLKFTNQMAEGSWGFPSGASYTGDWVYGHAHLMSCFGSALGYNYLDQFPHLKDMFFYYFNWIRPTTVTSDNKGDHHRYAKLEIGSFQEAGFEPFMATTQILGKLFTDVDTDTAGFIRWVQETSWLEADFPEWDDYGTDHWGLYRFLHGIKGLAQKTPSQANISNSHRFGQGRTWMWSHFGEDATVIYFECPTFTWSTHDIDDISQIMIWKNGNLTPSMGHNKAGLSVSFTAGSRIDPIWSNRLGFYTGSNHRYKNYGYDLSYNAYYDHVSNKVGGQNQVGSITVQDLDGTTHDYIDYDLTLAHDVNDEINHNRRAVLYIRDPNTHTNNEWLVVLDSASTDGNVDIVWTMHFAETPVNLGSGVYRMTADNTSLGSGIDGRAFFKTLLPASLDAEVVRGGGSAFYEDRNGGEGHVIQANTDYNDWTGFWAGQSTIHLQENATNGVFFTVFQICADNSYTTMSTTTNISGVGGFYGANMNDVRYAFISNGTGMKNSFTYASFAAGTKRIFICGMTDGAYNSGAYTVADNVFYLETTLTSLTLTKD